jgi:hypothetical protein
MTCIRKVSGSNSNWYMYFILILVSSIYLLTHTWQEMARPIHFKFSYAERIHMNVFDVQFCNKFPIFITAVK